MRSRESQVESGNAAGQRNGWAEMDMTPMVDVTFLLLIFFMVTASFVVSKAQQVPTPESTTAPSNNARQLPPEEDASFVVVEIDENNSYWVSTPTWQREAPSAQELLVMLRRAQAEGQGGTIPTRMLIKANGEALHHKVVTAVDLATVVGMSEVQLTTIEET